MDWLITIRAMALILLAVVLVYSIVRILRRKSQLEKRESGVLFFPSIGFAWQDGFKSIALLLSNKSREHVWTEEVEIALTDLRANQQTAEPSCREVHKIRQSIGPRDMMPISLVETIYIAAGKPQREYTCILSSIVRYRVGEKSFEELMPAYKLKMIGLTVSEIHGAGKSLYDFKANGNLQDSNAMSTLPK